jgi:hypothetical protein
MKTLSNGIIAIILLRNASQLVGAVQEAAPIVGWICSKL